MKSALDVNYQIVDEVAGNSLVRGPRPNFNDVAFLKQFKTVINFEVGWFEFFTHHVEQERETLAMIGGIEYVHKPMSDFCAPTPQFLQQTVYFIQNCLQSGNVLVHCLHGEDRTGMVCAAYRVLVNKWTPDAAINEMYNNGFHKVPYCYWVPALRRLT